ncbi:MAG: 1-acyl-sn-glycerol-3-phosphate acyltransferase [Treponema sp.]|nr:1-acyl-sn-glycerol-3-phosphate acyltransferase [Treponema sp.]
MIKEHIVEDDVYIPETNITYPENPFDFIVKAEKIREVNVDEHYPFIDNSFKGRFLRLRIYLASYFFAFPANRLLFGLKIKNRSNIRKAKKYLKNGAITISNHVYRWDFLAILYACRYRRMWVPVRTEHLEGKDAKLIRGIGGIPLAQNLGGGRKFNEAFDKLHEKKQWIHIFPEGSRWDFYQPIRPFKKGAFTFAHRWNVPMIPMAFSYRKPTGIFRLFAKNHPLITLTVGDLIFPDETLSRKDACEKMRNEAHAQMIKLAGIKQNKWPANYDE